MEYSGEMGEYFSNGKEKSTANGLSQLCHVILMLQTLTYEIFLRHNQPSRLIT